MKKVLSILLALTMVLTFVPVGVLAASEAQAGTFSYSVTNGKATVIGYVGLGGDLTIPNSYNGYSVTAIGEKAFDKLAGLKSVTMPDSVISIGAQAFAECNSLNLVNFGSGITSIGDYAFYNCPKLTVVRVPGSVSTIGISAFGLCSQLIQINVDAANLNYSSSDGVLLNQTKTALIQYPGGKIGAYTLPGSVTEIRGYAFNFCSGLTSVIIPDSVTLIGEAAFAGCEGLTSVIIGNGVTVIGGGAFDRCYGLKSLIIGSRVAAIGEQAFGYCTELTSFILPGSLTLISARAFISCSTLTSITIPNSVTEIEAEAFSDCIGLKSITIPASVTEIGEEAFEGCEGLTSVILENGVTTIPDDMFTYCIKLAAITIPGSVTAIGSSAFSRCYSLASISIQDSVKYIGAYTFEDTPWYKNKPDGIVYAGKVAYKYKGTMPANTAVVLTPDTLAIAEKAFDGCSGLKSVAIPAGMTNLGRDAFNMCSGLIEINVEAANTNYSSLDGVLFNKTKTAIVQYPVGRNGAYIIPNSVTAIGDFSFSGCSGLTVVTIHGSVTSVGNYAFEYCENLVAAYFLGNAPEMGYGVFIASNSSFFVYYLSGKTGFSNPWKGFPTEMITGTNFAKIRNVDSIYGNNFNVKVPWYQFYKKMLLKLTFAYYISNGSYTKVEWLSDNSKVVINEKTGIVTNVGTGARSANITVRLTESNGAVVTDTVKVVFYKFSWQLKSLSKQ